MHDVVGWVRAHRLVVVVGGTAVRFRNLEGLIDLPIAAAEGFVTGTAVAFIHKVRPEMLALPMRAAHTQEVGHA